MAEIIPSGICLKNLIQDHHAEILAREKNNDRCIHLYNIGTYWVAFERSACRLNGLFPSGDISLFRVPGLPDYVVMASIPVDEAEAYFSKHIVFRDGVHHKVLSDNRLVTRDYYKWHEVAVKSVLQ